MSRGGITLRKFEPIKPEKEVISLRLDTRMLQEINDWAMEIDISRNEFINQCIDFALKRRGRIVSSSFLEVGVVVYIHYDYRSI